MNGKNIKIENVNNYHKGLRELFGPIVEKINNTDEDVNILSCGFSNDHFDIEMIEYASNVDSDKVDPLLDKTIVALCFSYTEFMNTKIPGIVREDGDIEIIKTDSDLLLKASQLLELAHLGLLAYPSNSENFPHMDDEYLDDNEEVEDHPLEGINDPEICVGFFNQAFYDKDIINAMSEDLYTLRTLYEPFSQFKEAYEKKIHINILKTKLSAAQYTDVDIATLINCHTEIDRRRPILEKEHDALLKTINYHHEISTSSQKDFGRTNPVILCSGNTTLNYDQILRIITQYDKMIQRMNFKIN